VPRCSSIFVGVILLLILLLSLNFVHFSYLVPTAAHQPVPFGLGSKRLFGCVLDRGSRASTECRDWNVDGRAYVTIDGDIIPALNTFQKKGEGSKIKGSGEETVDL